MNDMYHTCRWCKHYEEGRCLKLIDKLGIEVVERNLRLDVNGVVEIVIDDPENFYCKEWE